MPSYQCRCEQCREHFELVESKSEHGGPAAVPEVRGGQVARVPVKFHAKTSKKS